jgi:type VI secretion system protein ImpF
LIDEEPHIQSEAAKTPAQQLRELRQTVRRDLEDLLNTRWRCVAWPPDLSQLDDSLVNYGIPDFTSAKLEAAEDPQILLKAIELAIRRFEPRLNDVRITQLEPEDRINRIFQFRIDAVLCVESLRDAVRFDSSLEPATGTFEVKGETR